MMSNNIFSSRYYRLNKLLMRQIGIWPEQSLTARIVLPTLFIVTIGSILVPELIRMYDIWGNIDNIIEGLPSMIMILISWIKLLNAAVKRTALLKILDCIKHEWESSSKSPSTTVILKKNAEAGRVLTITYVVFVYVASLAFIGLPVVPLALDLIAPLNDTRPKKYLYATEYRVDPEEYYCYVLFHSYVASYTCITIHVVIDTMFAVWVQHGCALFEIVGHNLRHADEKLDLIPYEVHTGSELAYKNLCFCVRKHKEAIMLTCVENRFANLIESTYSTSLAFIVGFNMMIISITGVLVVINLNDPEETLRLLALTLGQVYHLYYNSVPGQKMVDNSNQIKDYAYESEWCTFSSRAQKLLILIIARAQKACLFTAGKVYVINMENFSAVVKTSVSYFTVLSSLR